jgi:hypothetical protein
MIKYDKSIFRLVNELFTIPQVLEYLIRHDLQVASHEVLDNTRNEPRSEPFDFCICSVSRTRREEKAIDATDSEFLNDVKLINKNLISTIIDGMYSRHIDSEHLGSYPKDY